METIIGFAVILLSSAVMIWAKRRGDHDNNTGNGIIFGAFVICFFWVLSQAAQ